jgi:hypothetical protein
MMVFYGEGEGSEGMIAFLPELIRRIATGSGIYIRPAPNQVCRYLDIPLDCRLVERCPSPWDCR